MRGRGAGSGAAAKVRGGGPAASRRDRREPRTAASGGDLPASRGVVRGAAAPRAFGSLIAALWLSAAGLSAGAAQSLSETIRLALANDPSVSAASQGVRSAELTAAAAFRSTLPSLSIGGSYQYISTTAQITLPSLPGKPAQTIDLAQQNTVDTSVGIRWAPFTGFAQAATVESKKLEALLAENNLDATRIGVALKTIIAYRQAQAGLLQIDILASARDRAQLQIDKTAALERQGMAQKVDVLTLTIARLGYDQKLIAARAELADALERLRSITGRAISVPPPPTESLDVTLPPLQIDRLDQIKAFTLQRGLLDQTRRLAASKLYPTLAVSGALHYGIPGVNPIEDQWMFYGTAGASLSWSFDWGGDLLSVRAADHNLRKLASDELAARRAIELQYSSAVRAFHAMKSEADLLKASLDLAHTKMGIVKAQLDQGMATTTDFNDANLGLTQAELQYRSQLLALLLQANQIDAASGEPLDRWSVTR